MGRVRQLGCRVFRRRHDSWYALCWGGVNVRGHARPSIANFRSATCVALPSPDGAGNAPAAAAWSCISTGVQSCRVSRMSRWRTNIRATFGRTSAQKACDEEVTAGAVIGKEAGVVPVGEEVGLLVPLPRLQRTASVKPSRAGGPDLAASSRAISARGPHTNPRAGAAGW